MPRPIWWFCALAVSLLGTASAHGAEVCVQRNGVEMCAVDKGFCAAEHIFGQGSRFSATELYFQVVTLRIRNHTTRNLTISPENFIGEAETGERYVVDRSLHESINWPQKLISQVLRPNESLKGDLLFPVISHPVRRLIHTGHPFLETVLY